MGRKWVWAICVVLLLCWQQAAPVPVPATAHRAPTPAMSAAAVAKHPPNERAATDCRRQMTCGAPGTPDALRACRQIIWEVLRVLWALLYPLPTALLDLTCW